MKDIMYNTKEVLENIIFCREKRQWKRTRSKYKLSNYDILDSVRIYNELLIKNQAFTINTNVANFYKSLGFTVMLDDESINYVIRKGIDDMKITREQFNSYEAVRQSGAYNMLSLEARELSGLDKDTYMEIVKNYSKLKEMYK